MILAACAALAAVAAARKGAPSQLMAATADGPESPASPRFVPASIINTSQNLGTTTLVLDIAGEDSWDSLNDASNTILVVPLGAGASMTGIGWDVNLSTVGGSWLSEARFYFDGDDQDLMGLFLTPGVGNNAPGIMSFSSGGVLDLSDNAIPDIPMNADGNLYIQLYEGFDDAADAIDANWTAGSTLTIAYEGAPPVPTVGTWAMIALGVSLLGGVVVVTLRRKASPQVA